MKESLIDTDILSYYFKGDKVIAHRFDIYLNYFDKINFSIITYFEILSGLLIRDSRGQLRKFEAFCLHNSIINLSPLSVSMAAQIAATLYIKGAVIGNQDILIVASAMENNFVLVTNNEKHFRG
jgi:tRNA(fMet)-specific endonuclease VapC